jgi:hypothetical protein
MLSKSIDIFNCVWLFLIILIIFNRLTDKIKMKDPFHSIKRL